MYVFIYICLLVYANKRRYLVLKEYAESFYTGTKWKNCRAAYIKTREAIDGGMCERCKMVPGYIVHHKEYITPDNINNPDVTLNLDNLEYLCLDCHNKEHMTKQDKRYVFGENGEILPP